ncbi:C1q-related factor [Merluccius polli]|uniref:C1q-related factor n=1 Tax=Merluccius polli TaxID=89951 RepID=A0AA47M810_MERPO|nr:C1q-related factor [Merluccius polli]
MKLVELSLMCLWGLLCLCTSAYATDNFIAEMADAARDFHGLLPCGKWDCKCANQQRDCCCAAKEMMTLEDTTFNWMMDLWLDVKDLEKETNALTENRHIAFSAAMPAKLNSFGPFTASVTIPYTTITLNDGNGYNPALGVFTALFPGTFSFSYTVYSNVGHPNERIYHKVQMMMDGKVVASTWEDNREDQEDSGSQVVVLHLRRGCQVYMELVAGRSLSGDMTFNKFSGFLLYHD